jgi:hypothetical protein
MQSDLKHTANTTSMLVVTDYERKAVAVFLPMVQFPSPSLWHLVDVQNILLSTNKASDMT